ncbi:MAG: protein-L-isoaspartate(D-aspartate) O-methyltransferase [Candidatus Ranarchaeia archaeon]
MDPHMIKAKCRLFKRLVDEGLLLSRAVMEAFLRVPREEFLPKEARSQAYIDSPLPIGWRQTISAPHMCVMMLEALNLFPGLKVLEVGTGSGYHAALCAEMVAPSQEPMPRQLEELLPEKRVSSNVDQAERKGHVFTIERIHELALAAKERLKKCGYGSRVTVITGDGTVGHEKEAPYERILVTAASPSIPASLEQQLALGGCMVIPVGKISFHQSLIRLQKSRMGHITKEDLCGVAFVPLIGKEGWQGD